MLYNKNDWPRKTIALQLPRFVPWPPDTTVVRVPKLSLRNAGWKKIGMPVTRLSVKSYVDMETGEIIKKRDMFEQRLPVPSNASLRWIEQLCIVNSLGKKAKELCVFLLKMRNSRGSFVLPLANLIDVYIHRNGTVLRISRARHSHYDLIGDIAAAGVIAQEQALGSLFQKHARLSAQDVLEESAAYYAWPGIFRGRGSWVSES
ncbi:hypothetical protein LMG29542_00206 [Paraburkholderia humisilvae]|uniref:Uncharacterized protein n=1 Tax=Paraburkholderia humisilvae TaxID=627669 RepID=A0A6J5CW87_9BURK|nr:hypothetical protein LMG29542_00206 [Paraburkholderia humisilvae]